MKKLALWLLSTGVVVAGTTALVGLPTSAWSPAINSDDEVTVSSDATHEGALYAVGKDVVRIDGTVDGDVYCAATTVVISGTVNGDVMCAGQSVTVEGDISQDVRLAGQNVDLAGQVEGSATVFAQNFSTGRDLQLGGDLNGATQSADIAGVLGGGIVMASQNIRLSAEVVGDLDIQTTLLRLASGASVAGDVNYQAPREIAIDDAAVTGSVNYLGSSSGQGELDIWEDVVAGLLTLLVMMVVSALVLAAVAPRFINRASVILSRQPLNTVLYGFAVVFGAPLVATALLLSVFAAPLGIVLLLAWGIVLLLSSVFVAYYIGAVLLRGVDNVLLRMLGGVLVLAILMLLPLLNVLVIFATIVVGSGMVVATLLHNYRRPSYQLDSRNSTSRSAKPVSKTKTTSKK